MRSILRTAALFCAAVSASAIWAQQVDAYLGVSTARDGSAGQSIETFSDGTLYSTPSLGGVYTDFGATVFFSRQFGVGWDASWRSDHDYAGLQFRPKFNSFDAVFQPARLRTERIVPEFRAGLGFASVNFDYDDPVSCSQVPGCPSSHHFLGDAGVAARLYVTHHIFVRPAVNVQYVKNFYLFGSNWVPRYSVSVGYSFGRE